MRSLKVAVVRQTFTVLSLPDSLIAEITEILRREGKRDKKSTRRSTKLQLASKPFY